MKHSRVTIIRPKCSTMSMGNIEFFHNLVFQISEVYINKFARYPRMIPKFEFKLRKTKNE